MLYREWTDEEVLSEYDDNRREVANFIESIRYSIDVLSGCLTETETLVEEIEAGYDADGRDALARMEHLADLLDNVSDKAGDACDEYDDQDQV